MEEGGSNIWGGGARRLAATAERAAPSSLKSRPQHTTLLTRQKPNHSLLCFFGIYLGVVNNTSWRRFVRFNAMQAVLLDILLILPRLIESLISPPTAGWGLQAYISAQNTVWLFVTACVLYGIGSSLLGLMARIPFVADAADQQVR